MRFLVADLGREDLLLGYPWLHKALSTIEATGEMPQIKTNKSRRAVNAPSEQQQAEALKAHIGNAPDGVRDLLMKELWKREDF